MYARSFPLWLSAGSRLLSLPLPAVASARGRGCDEEGRVDRLCGPSRFPLCLSAGAWLLSLFFLCTFLQAHTSFSDSLPYSVLQTPDRERSRVYPTGREEREPKFRLARPYKMEAFCCRIPPSFTQSRGQKWDVKIRLPFLPAYRSQMWYNGKHQPWTFAWNFEVFLLFWSHSKRLKSLCLLRRPNFETASWPNHVRWGHGSRTFSSSGNKLYQYP